MDQNQLLASESTVPSSPTAADKVSFSDQPIPTSTPPSSPPGFPWEQQSKSSNDTADLQRPTRSVYSFLGKRKALEPLSENTCPAKKPITASTKSLTQMQINLGQEVQKKCKTCGMEYVASSSEDRKLHGRYHKQNVEGYDVGKDFVQKARKGTVVSGVRIGDKICAVDCFDKLARRKRGQAALEVVQRELGAVEIPEKDIWDVKSDAVGRILLEPRYRAYLYIRRTKCVGFMLVEKIKEAYRVVEPSFPLEHPKTAESQEGRDMGGALAALRARQRLATERQQQPIELSKETTSPRLGISRIWTSPTHRHQNIATALLDTALKHHDQLTEISDPATAEAFADADLRDGSEKRQAQINALVPVTGTRKDKAMVAFSQPTEAGVRLARRWFGSTYGWSVYVD